LNVQKLGVRINLQTWNICRKIGEVDFFIRENRHFIGHVRESHPEICYWALSAGHAMHHSKKTRAGLHERMSLLHSLSACAEDIFRKAVNIFPRKNVALDDILDALVLALSAKICRGNLVSLPGVWETDDLGLPMEIVYCGR
jgi:predicted RNase H-like nuclease